MREAVVQNSDPENSNTFTFNELTEMYPDAAKEIQSIIFQSNKPRSNGKWINSGEHEKNCTRINEILKQTGLNAMEILSPLHIDELPTLSDGKRTLEEWMNELKNGIQEAAFHDAIWSGRR